ncbi:hypothetical protein F5Y00DRAFT_55468 [Daldinia vernicosa]|uniref:uncharacterized protein n=1 Tax=Daldinia vernicosa TaxID=114800 RepID=UPI002007E85D|nr:uncharacterized protein F5Y00DRAFT_55468 [Daldinia vernicosa]KAI0849642.1 hypothetical protein F5Y00DRAFT_55468 [Daldinia vernicosa]
MIRHPLNSAVGRARPDLNRVADGIAASLRQFSVSARRSSAEDDNDDDYSQRHSSRQRSIAAVNELIATVDSGINFGASRPAQNTTTTTATTTANPPPPARSQGPNIITLKNIPRGFNGITRTPSGGPNIIRTDSLPSRGGFNSIGRTGAPAGMPLRLGANGGPNIIRGGFRGRGGGGSFPSGGGSPRFGPPRQGGPGGGSPRFGPPRGGGNRRPDDRPQRARRARGSRRQKSDDDERGVKRQEEQQAKDEEIDTPAVKAYLEGKETGKTMAFNPSLSLASLAGWGPAVATSSSPFGQGETVLRQARILGGGQAFHPQHLEQPLSLHLAWRDGNGAFVPPSREARLWKKQVLKDRPFEAPAEVKTAVLEDALLGRYGEGPKYADPEDTIGTLRSYVRRDGTWNAHAQRSIEAKVRSLLGQSGGQPAGSGAAKPEAKA